MNIAPYIKLVGRGKDGARPIGAAEAEAVFGAVLDGAVDPVQLGAFLIAMRIKGESTDELAGFLAAARARCLRLTPTRPTVVLPSYNGARKLPNLTPLLAMLLAQEGVQVLVHGQPEDPTRVTTAAIFHDLGLPVARSVPDIEHAWARHDPVYIATADLCPPLARLLDVRWTVGLRNSGHTIAKLLDPCAAHGVRVVNHTHPEYASMLGDFLSRIEADALLMRGTEGEPVADPRRAPRMLAYVGGAPRPDLSMPMQDGVLAELPLLPKSIDAATTALYVRSVVSGEKPAPAPVLQQLECIGRILDATRATPLKKEHTA